MSWPNETMLGLDFETTGVNPLECRTVTVALVEMDGTGALVKANGAVIDSGVEIPDEAAAVHGYTTLRVKEEGRTPEDVFPKLLTLLIGHAKDHRPLVMFNARFDWTLLHAEAERVGMLVPEFNIIDPFIMDKALDKYRKGSRKLVDTAKYYDVPLLDAHTASADALAACGVARAIGRTYPAVADMPLSTLQTNQAYWFQEWKASFNAYLLKKNPDEPDLVTGDWPLVVA